MASAYIVSPTHIAMLQIADRHPGVQQYMLGTNAARGSKVREMAMSGLLVSRGGVELTDKGRRILGMLESVAEEMGLSEEVGHE